MRRLNNYCIYAFLITLACTTGCKKDNSSSTDASSPAPAAPAPAASALQLTLSGPASIAVGTCADFTVTSVSSSNAAVAVAQDTTITLSGASLGSFYSDAGCATAASSVVISNGQSGATVYLMDTHIENLSLSATSTGWTDAAASASVTAGSLNQIRFSQQPSASATAGVALGSVALELTDASGNSVDSSNVSLAAFTDSACTSAGSGTLSAGGNPGASSGGTVSFTAVTYTKSGTFYLGASAGGVTGCSNAISVAANVPARLSLNMAVLSGPSIGTPFLPMASFLVEDAYGNPTLSNDTFSIGVFGDSACTAPMSVQTGGATSGLATAGFGYINEAPAGSLTPVFVFNTFTTFYVGLTDTSRSAVTVGCSSAISVGPGLASGSTGTTQCAISSSGSAYCWGTDTYGQCGDNQHAGFPPYTLYDETPVQVLGGAQGGSNLANVTSISDSNGTTCAVTNDGSVYCWGLANTGTLGDGAWAMSPTPVQVVGVGGTGNLSNIANVAVGYEFACAVSSLATGGNVYCWGYNAQGQLGNGSTTETNTPIQVTGLSGMIAVTVGEEHACALSSTGGIYCWGDNTYGQLGNNSTTGSSTPVQVKGTNGSGTLGKIAAIAAGMAHNCALSGNAMVYCWGYNGMGQLGNNTQNDAHYPVQVKTAGGSGFYPANAVSVGLNHSCALQVGFVYCWGDNEYGQMGNSNAPTNNLLPGKVNGLNNGAILNHITALGSSGFSTCAVTNTNAVVCWGAGSSGQLGNNSLSQSNFPVQVLGVSGVGSLGL